MLSRTLLIAVLASPLFVPVTCTSVMLPVAHGLSHARVHDVAAGEPLYVPEVSVPLVERLNPNPALAVAIDIDELPAALQRWPGLTPRLPPDGNTAGPGADRLYWRVLDEGPDGQRVELLHDGADVEHTVRYRATEAGVTLLTSRRFSDAESRPGFAVGLAVALALMVAMRRVRARRNRWVPG
jgi:hypothetical protein